MVDVVDTMMIMIEEIVDGQTDQEVEVQEDAADQEAVEEIDIETGDHTADQEVGQDHTTEGEVHHLEDPDHTADPHHDHQLMIIHQEKVEVVLLPIMNKYTDIC